VLPDRTIILAVTKADVVHVRVAAITRDELEARVKAVRVALGVDGPGLRIAVRAPSETKTSETKTSAPKTSAPKTSAPKTKRKAARLSAEELLTSLYALLIEPVEGLLPKGEPLVIEPHGALWLLPFAALTSASGAPLVDRCPLLFAPSARVLEQLRAVAPLGDPREVGALVVGNPTMPEITSADGASVALLPLKGAEGEARAIAKRLGARAKLLLGPDATEGAVKQAMVGAAVIHLATHGIADSADPLASMIALSPGPPAEGSDGILTAKELMKIPITADLVALSACQTALGKISEEGMIGLARALLWSGARALLVSQWSVDDDATRPLMAAFYKAFLGGADKATALQRAARELRREHPMFEHPRYWAPFVLIGAEA
jgi:CHAT domain-containing protein